MADYFERSGRAHAAQVARAEARRLFHGPEEPFSRFAERLFEKAMRVAASEAAPPGSTQAGPASTAAPPPASTERRSPGGLILP